MARDNIATMLSGQRWFEYERPFRHLRATNVFRREIYETLELNFRNTLTEFNVTEVGQANNSDSRYDAWTMGVTPSTAALFYPFFSREWHDLISNLVGVATTGHIDGGLHHHRVGSANGWIHNDLCVGWFPGPCGATNIVLSDHAGCNYSTGVCRDRHIEPVCVVRSVALIFYLANSDWAPGYGGDTGLYETPFDSIQNASASVPPVNNSLIIFECTPHSYHSFRSNLQIERNCIVLWAHSTVETVSAKFGKASIAKWT
ncbi:2OG-Fe(II) oxygenase [Bradyrhizobium tropiciagri]|uniref:2OG-Fe(II) oxygenase family protein n=1 Tax=Bradyrhizobium tropiciagri TaxID=312253 RepID=UPI001BA7FD5B|nr:2OG-Fe(II) oxygenase [Bradyrhizobium tropiciagri]